MSPFLLEKGNKIHKYPTQHSTLSLSPQGWQLIPSLFYIKNSTRDQNLHFLSPSKQLLSSSSFATSRNRLDSLLSFPSQSVPYPTLVPSSNFAFYSQPLACEDNKGIMGWTSFGRSWQTDLACCRLGVKLETRPLQRAGMEELVMHEAAGMSV